MLRVGILIRRYLILAGHIHNCINCALLIVLLRYTSIPKRHDKPRTCTLAILVEEEQRSSDERSEANSREQEVEQLRTELQEAKTKIQTLNETISSLQTRVDQGKDRIRQMWRNNCQYVAEVDEELSRKDNEIRRLQETI